MTASQYVAFINRKYNLCLQTSLFLRHYKSGYLNTFFKYSLLFKRSLGETDIAIITALFLASPSLRQASLIHSTLTSNATQFHFDLMPQSCDHFIASHDFFLLKRKKDNMREYAVNLPIFCSHCDHYRHCVFTDL